MSIETLVSCMNQKDMSIVNSLSLKTDAIIINQCQKDMYNENLINNGNIKMISSTKKGLTNSRNLALAYASADICVLCDDDVEYNTDYDKTIIEAFNQLPDADLIIFNISPLNYSGNIKDIKKIRKAPRYKAYQSVRIAFRLESIKRGNIWFNVNFGSGSIYSSGEELLFLQEAQRKGLNIYEYPGNIAKVDFSQSTWRKGYNEKYFYDKGALLAAAYPLLKYFFMFYFLLRLKKYTPMNSISIIKWLLSGIKGYKKLLSYNEFTK